MKRPRLQPDEFGLERVDQPGHYVVLRYPDDQDIANAIHRDEITVARGIKRIATRRQFERETAEIERREREANAWREESQ